MADNVTVKPVQKMGEHPLGDSFPELWNTIKSGVQHAKTNDANIEKLAGTISAMSGGGIGSAMSISNDMLFGNEAAVMPLINNTENITLTVIRGTWSNMITTPEFTKDVVDPALKPLSNSIKKTMHHDPTATVDFKNKLSVLDFIEAAQR